MPATKIMPFSVSPVRRFGFGLRQWLALSEGFLHQFLVGGCPRGLDVLCSVRYDRT
jgi:hypothetical protein